MTDDRCRLDGKNFEWGMTKFTQPQDRTAFVSHVYCINKSSGMVFREPIEILDSDTQAMSFETALETLHEKVTAVLENLKKTVIDFYAKETPTKQVDE